MSTPEIRPAPTTVPGTSIRVPKSIREMTDEIVGNLPADVPMAVVAQALHSEGRTVVRGAVYARLRKDLTFVGYVSHNLKPKGLTAGAELRWTPKMN